MTHLVKQESQDYGRGKTKKQIVKTDQKSIPQKTVKIGAVEKPYELCKPYPWTAGKTPARRKILKSNQRPVHGFIGKKCVKKNNRQDQKIERPVSLHVLPD